jgi:3-polyprenyl-4-hydroxybenzoate decarboxylase
MRNDAIFKNVQNGTEVEGCVYHKVPMSAQILRRARNVGGLADVRNVLVMPGIFGVVVQMKPRYYGEAKNVLDVGSIERISASQDRHRRR